MPTTEDKLFRTIQLAAAGSLFGVPGALLGAGIGAVPLLASISDDQASKELHMLMDTVGFNDSKNRMANRFLDREYNRTTESRCSREPFHTIEDECAYIKRAIPVEIAKRELYERADKKKKHQKGYEPQFNPYSPGYWNLRFLEQHDTENFYAEGWDKLMYIRQEPKVDKEKENQTFIWILLFDLFWILVFFATYCSS